MTVLICTQTSSAASYGSVLKKFTRDSRSFATETFDAELIWHATMLSDKMIAAQRALCEKRQVECDLPKITGNAFFVTLYSHKALEGFSMDKNSVWKMSLVGENGEEVAPIKIEKVTITPMEMTFYTYLDRWSRPYIVEFPPVALGKEPKLILRSIMASSSVKWKFQ